MTSGDTSEIVENVNLIQQLAFSDGNLEAPINLDMCNMQEVKLNRISWFNNNDIPKKLKLTNTGHTVLISATWPHEVPSLFDGPFTEKYVFCQMHFHWGETEMNGSEHTVDGARFLKYTVFFGVFSFDTPSAVGGRILMRRNIFLCILGLHFSYDLHSSMPMELHAVYIKNEYDTLEVAAQKEDGIAILVYLFKLQDQKNMAIDVIVKSLPAVQMAHSTVRLTPIRISKIMKPFTENYFLYWGSIMIAGYAHRILWLISRVPLGISVEQLAEFRTLYNDKNSPILSNHREIQPSGNRQVFHINRSGSMYASLLPIPWESVSSDDNEDTNSTVHFHENAV